MSATATQPAARKKPARTLSYNALVGAVWLTVGKDTTGYWLDRLAHDFHGGYTCVRLTKMLPDGEADHYDVCLDPSGQNSSCECRGFLRHGHKAPCKHLAAVGRLLADGKL